MELILPEKEPIANREGRVRACKIPVLFTSRAHFRSGLFQVELLSSIRILLCFKVKAREVLRTVEIWRQRGIEAAGRVGRL